MHKNKIVTPINIFALFFLLALPSSCPISWFQARLSLPFIIFSQNQAQGGPPRPLSSFFPLFYCFCQIRSVVKMEETLQAFLSAFVIITIPILLSQLSINLIEKNKTNFHRYIALYFSIIALLSVLAVSPFFVYLKIYLDNFIKNQTMFPYFLLSSAMPFLSMGYDFIPFASMLICIKSFNFNKKLYQYIIISLLIGLYIGVVIAQLSGMYL